MDKDEMNDYLDDRMIEYCKMVEDIRRDGDRLASGYCLVEISTDPDDCPADCLGPVYPFDMVNTHE